MSRASARVRLATERMIRSSHNRRYGNYGMGGRAAEDLVLQATRAARAMVAEYGMSDVLGPVVVDDVTRSKRLMTEANESATDILRGHREHWTGSFVCCWSTKWRTATTCAVCSPPRCAPPCRERCAQFLTPAFDALYKQFIQRNVTREVWRAVEDHAD